VGLRPETRRQADLPQAATSCYSQQLELAVRPTSSSGASAQAGGRAPAALRLMRSTAFAAASCPYSLQSLRYKLHTGLLQPGACTMLELAADPRKQLAGGGGGGTLRGGPLHLLPGGKRAAGPLCSLRSACA